MKWTQIPIILFFSINVFSQTKDTLLNAKSFYSSYENSTFTGVDAAGHVYGVIFSKDYNGGNWGNVTVYRIDYTTKHIASKIMPNSATQAGIMWRSAMDSSGTVYFSQANNRQVWKFNFKQEDSISMLSLGNTSLTGNGLAYSIWLGRDGGMYFGNSSSNESCDWAYQAKGEDTLRKYPNIDTLFQYVIQMAPDSNWVYAQVGQWQYRIYAIEKSTGNKHEIMRRTDGYPFNLGASKNGCYVSIGGGATWKLVDGDTVMVPPAPASTGGITYNETKQFPDATNLPLVSSFFDQSVSKLYYAVNSVTDNVQMVGNYYPNTITRLFPDKIVTNRVSYAGSLYGYYTDYYVNEDSAVTRGYIGFNTYCGLQLNDTLSLYGGYPSGVLAMYNRNQPWTAETFANAAYKPLSASTNPKMLTQFRGLIDIHHLQKIVKIDSLIIGAGDVIRTGNSVGIGTYNMVTGQTYGQGMDFFPNGYYVDIAVWGKKVLLSTNDFNGQTPKIYIYEPYSGVIEDSIYLGYHNYGKIYVTGDLLFGITNDSTNKVIFYKINLSTKQKTYEYITTGVINMRCWFEDGIMGINATGVTLPKDFMEFRQIDNTEYHTCIDGKCYAIGNGGYNVVQYTGVTHEAIDLSTAQGKEDFLSNWLK